jgi:hypothetical protein
MTGGPARIISGFGDADADGVNWRARIFSTTGGKRKLTVGIGVGEDTDSESRAFRMASAGWTKLNVGVGADNDAEPPREPMTPTEAVGADDDAEPPKELMTPTVAVGADDDAKLSRAPMMPNGGGNDDNWRAFRITHRP